MTTTNITIPLFGSEMAVQKTYSELDMIAILWDKKHQGKTLRAIAQEYPGLNFGDISRGLKGIFPRSAAKRRAFGLEAYRAVVLMSKGDVPQGAQVIAADQCPCGQWFISNHPRRKKCFKCSPYRKSLRIV